MAEPRPDLIFQYSSFNPEDRHFLDASFVNRSRELKVCHAMFRPQDPSHLIYAVHGYSRVGKSHLAMKFAADVEAAGRVIYFYVNANTRSTAYNILKGLFRLVRDRVFDEQLQPHPDEACRDAYAFLKQYVLKIKSLFEMPVSKLTFKTLHKDAQKLASKFSVRIPFVDVSLGGDKTHSDSEEQLLELEKPDLGQLTEILEFLFDALAFATRRTVLILLDDLDLLEELKEGANERDMLTEQLKNIAAVERIAVMITTRQRFFTDRDREMVELLRVQPMAETDLVAVYQRRVALFNDGQEVFEPDVVARLAEGFEGMTGAFLKECDQLHREYIFEVNEHPVTMAQFERYLDKVLDDFEKDPDTYVFFDDIRNHVKDNKFELVLRRLNKEHGLVYRVVIPLGYGSDNFRITRLFATAIHKRLQD